MTNQHTIPFLDLDGMNKPIRRDIMREITKVIETNSFTLGEVVTQFEHSFAAYNGLDYCVGTSDGTMAIRLMLEAYNVRGGEVIIPANTFVATAEAIIEAGATPVLADINDLTWLMEAEDVEKVITPNTKAILLVHMFGNVCHMDEFYTLADLHNIPLLVDACQAHGATWKGQRSYALADAAAFSFYPGKNLGAFGDAGAVVTSNKSVADKVRRLRHHGQDLKSVHSDIGTTGRLDAIQAAVLRVKLMYLDTWNLERSRVDRSYIRYLCGRDGFDTAVEYSHSNSANHLFPVIHQNHEMNPRGLMISRLNAANIGYGIHYPIPIHLTPAFYRFFKATEDQPYGPGTFPNAERLANSMISLPMYPSLTDSEVRYISEVLLGAK